MNRDDQSALVEVYYSACEQTLRRQRQAFHAKIQDGSFDEDDAEFLKASALDLVRDSHRIEIEAALAEQPAQNDMH